MRITNIPNKEIMVVNASIATKIGPTYKTDQRNQKDKIIGHLDPLENNWDRNLYCYIERYWKFTPESLGKGKVNINWFVLSSAGYDIS